MILVGFTLGFALGLLWGKKEGRREGFAKGVAFAPLERRSDLWQQVELIEGILKLWQSAGFWILFLKLNVFPELRRQLAHNVFENLSEVDSRGKAHHKGDLVNGGISCKEGHGLADSDAVSVRNGGAA